ncbi:MAG: hypothetical protein KDE54_00480 [Caldilineaceae bacterium]|nr:hypothetical protein [Caldilineaceae bacterium]MCB0143833.1 hypothetical protein [Caldilineaceae bacterium]
MINHIHPFDVPSTLGPRQYADLFFSTIGVFPEGVPELMPTDRGAPVVKADNGVELVNAVRQGGRIVELAEPEYHINAPLVFAPGVDLVGVNKAPVRVVAADGFKGSEMVSILQPGAGLENVDLFGRYLMVNGVQLEDAGDVLIKRCRLRSFQRNCLRMIGNTNHVAVVCCEMGDTKSNHGIGMQTDVSDVLIVSSAFHHCGQDGDDDGYGLDLHGSRVWVLGCVVYENHRGVKLPDAQSVYVEGGYVDDGTSHKYPPISIWRSEGGRRPNNITIKGMALDSQAYHIGIWNSDVVRFGNVVAMRHGKALDAEGAPFQLAIKGTAIRLPPVEPPVLPPVDAGPGVGELPSTAPELDALAGEVMRRLDVNELAHLVGQKLISSLSQVFK